MININLKQKTFKKEEYLFKKIKIKLKKDKI